MWMKEGSFYQDRLGRETALKTETLPIGFGLLTRVSQSKQQSNSSSSSSVGLFSTASASSSSIGSLGQQQQQQQPRGSGTCSSSSCSSSSSSSRVGLTGSPRRDNMQENDTIRSLGRPHSVWNRNGVPFLLVFPVHCFM